MIHYADDPRNDPHSDAAKRYRALLLGIEHEPAECFTACDDASCPYMHNEFWIVDGTPYRSVDEAIAARQSADATV